MANKDGVLECMLDGMLDGMQQGAERLQSLTMRWEGGRGVGGVTGGWSARQDYTRPGWKRVTGWNLALESFVKRDWLLSCSFADTRATFMICMKVPPVTSIEPHPSSPSALLLLALLDCGGKTVSQPPEVSRHLRFPEPRRLAAHLAGLNSRAN